MVGSGSRGGSGRRGGGRRGESDHIYSWLLSGVLGGRGRGRGRGAGKLVVVRQLPSQATGNFSKFVITFKDRADADHEDACNHMAEVSGLAGRLVGAC